MPFDVGTTPQPLIDAVGRGNLVPLVGSGISRQASSCYPTWDELLRDMANNAVLQGWMLKKEAGHISTLVKKHQHLMAAEAIRAKYPSDAYYGFLKDKFQTPDSGPARIQEATFSLKPPIILTTNYDTLLEDAYASKFGRHAPAWTPINSPDVANYLHTARASVASPIFKLHGTIANPPSIILTEGDYRGLIYRQPGYCMVVESVLITKVVLMLGFSGNDPELRLFLEGMREALQHRGDPDYIFLPKNTLNSTEKTRWREDFGVEAIEYEPTTGHPEVLELIEHLATFAPT
ncbi:MAG: hypothetical protein BZY75_02690 [SAR202 cluster bacterium Io17-Chloro-G7]|nr:MAG: hypothetical protein BZY75_02690 [SAR202 cluster bacterium Io17-Chloro-G7]